MSASKSKLGVGVLHAVERAGLPILLAVVFVIFATNSEIGAVFRSSANLDNILSAEAVTGLVALAMIVPLYAGYLDLSVGATCGIANITVAATLGTYGWPIPLAIGAGLLIGAAIGLINAILVAGLRLNTLVVTLGVYTALQGVAQLYTKGELIISGIPASVPAWGSDNWLGVPRPFIVLIVGAAIVWYLLTQVPFGRYLESIGSNETAARLVGIPVARSVAISFVLAGVIAGAAGALQVSRAGNGSANAASAFLFPAFAAVFLGATTIRPGRYNVWGTVIGVYFVAVSVNGFTLLGAQTWVQPVFNGVALVVAVALSTLIARRRETRTAMTLRAPPLPRQHEPDSEPPGPSNHGIGDAS